jgi:signal transduction histidine kinase
MEAATKQTSPGDFAGLNNEASDVASRNRATAELAQLALHSQDLDGILGLAVDLVREALGVEYVKVVQQPAVSEPLVLIAGSGWQDYVKLGHTTVPPNRQSQAGYTLLSNESVLVEDLARETRFSGSPLVLDHGVVSSMSVVVQGRANPHGVLAVHSVHTRSFSDSDGDFLRSIASILGIAIEHADAVEKVERSARYETALAECAQSLLASSGDDRIKHALGSLFVATEATFVFLERNVNHHELGFCSQFVGEAEHPDSTSYEVGNDYWDLVPWDTMPTSRQKLENGQPIVIIPEELEGPEYDQYAKDPYPVKTELEVPVFVNGEWAGLIGFSDQSVVRQWSETDLSLLTTASRMFGAFWEREADQQRLEELNDEKDKFLASVSHELRTPLTAVVGFGQILQESAETISTEDRAELLELVVEHGADLTNIIADLLVAAKADIGAMEVASVPVNLRAQASQVLESFGRDQVSNIELVGPSERAVGDPDRVRQIVRNLVSNARRYGGDLVRVEVLGDGTQAKVLVCDSGPALSDEDRELIFEPYRSAHSHPGVAESMGLGLAISRQLAELMGGHLIYRHQNGESIFELALQRHA